MRRPAIPQLKRYAIPVVVAFVALALGTVAFLAARQLSGGSPQAVADLGPNPPESPSVGAPWPDFSNKVLHWQNYSYSYDPGSADDANGQEIAGDIWLKVGPDNKPVALRGTFHHVNGTFHQEYLYAGGKEIVTYDRPMLPSDAPVDLPRSCRKESSLDAGTFDKLVNAGEPFYVDLAKATSLGFGGKPGPTSTIPALKPANIGATPSDVLDGGTAGRGVWQRDDPTADSGAAISILELDANTGRLLAETHIQRFPDGSEVTRSQRISTAVEVFAIEDVPVSVFDLATVREGC